MRCAVAFSILLASCGVLLGDSPSPGSSTSAQGATLLDDLVRMTRAGSSDATVLAYARAHRLELPAELSDASVRWLADSGVSQRVVRYMAAIDVRASSETERGMTSGSEMGEDAARSRGRYLSEGDSRRYEVDSFDDDLDRHAGDSRYPEGDSGAYGDFSSGYSSFDSYPWDYSPSFGYSYPLYPSYFFVDRFGSLRRFPRRDHRDDRFGGGRHRRGGVDHGRGHDAWRERGFRGGRGRGGPMLAGPRGSGRSGFARGGSRGGVPGLHGRVIGPRGFGSASPGRGHFASGFRGPRGGFTGHAGFRNPGFSGHPGPRAGGAPGHGTNRGMGAGRAPAGSPGARGRR